MRSLRILSASAMMARLKFTVKVGCHNEVVKIGGGTGI